jgi:FkbM family methyltransferase
MVIVDIGSRGGVIPILKSALPEAKFLDFEPLEETQIGDIKTTNLKRLRAGELATHSNSLVWNKEITIPFYVCKKRELSSVFRPNKEFISNYIDPSRFDIEHVFNIKADKLDNLVNENIDYIKIDAQGASFEILEGAKAHIDRNAPMLEVELEFEPIYKNQKLFEHTLSYLRDFNYNILHMEPHYWAKKRKFYDNKQVGSSLVWAQVFFAASSRSLIDKNVNLETRRKIARVLKFDSYVDELSIN